jgi:hypothetical protein
VNIVDDAALARGELRRPDAGLHPFQHGYRRAVSVPASFTEADGPVVVNFGVLTGREATIAELDRLARSVALTGGDGIRIVAQRVHEYDQGVETVAHQVLVRAEGIDVDEVERLATLWAHDCAADRHAAAL